FLIAYFWTYLKVTFLICYFLEFSTSFQLLFFAALEYKCLFCASLFTVVRSKELWVYYLIVYALHSLVVEFVIILFGFKCCIYLFARIFVDISCGKCCPLIQYTLAFPAMLHENKLKLSL
ncbi:hypothetical protein ACJX0J_026518, partial [Zea mays]